MDAVRRGMLFSLLILGLVWVHTALAEMTIGLELVADSLTHPVSFAVANDGTLYLSKPAAQPGAMWSMDEIKVAGKPNGRIGQYVLAFGEDEEREIYVLTTVATGPTGNRDQVFKIVPAK